VDDQPQPPVDDGLDHALDPRVVPLQRIGGWIFTAAIGGISFVSLLITLLAADDMPGWLQRAIPVTWLLLVAVNAWWAHVWPARSYRYTRYRVDEGGIEIRRGVYFREVINVPRSRVQHTDVSQGPIARRFGLGTLAIYTAGTEHAKVELAGLEHGRAMRIREHLLPSGSSDAV
jgi:membrane protein YdbS with pleckstrin-like domain